MASSAFLTPPYTTLFATSPLLLIYFQLWWSVWHITTSPVGLCKLRKLCSPCLHILPACTATSRFHFAIKLPSVRTHLFRFWHHPQCNSTGVHIGHCSYLAPVKIWCTPLSNFNVYTSSPVISPALFYNQPTVTFTHSIKLFSSLFFSHEQHACSRSPEKCFIAARTCLVFLRWYLFSL
jgi:hypothetical protein